MTYSKFEDIPVWQSSRAFVKGVFLMVDSNSKLQRNFGLADQLRRASSSILLNISEGFERGSNAEFAHFLNFAKASAGEVRSILYILYDTKYISESTFNEMHVTIHEISTSLANFRKFLLREKNRKR